jgi:hypothetical protein
MTFRANKNGTWVGGDDQSQGTVVYGKSGDNWLYAKEVFANNNGTWTRAWTDCRKLGAEGGRDWASTSGQATQGTCAERQEQTVTTYTKTGCPNYETRGPWVSAPACGAVGGSCWTNVTCSYINSTNFVFDGVFYTGVFDAGDNCYAYNESNCWAVFYSCGESIGTLNFCF